ncbi:MAG: ATP-binding cassette domain-containing protein [Streptosporangiales bacterium]|nr:ATP-binding cassette domain-containing protein [Streptosporangiales bacterium]
MTSLLEVEDLRVRFSTEDGVVRAVDGVSFEVDRGQTLGIVGESGSGKSVTSLAIMGLLRGRFTVEGSVTLGGDELVRADPDFVRELRGNRMAMIFQDPLSSLHPYYTVGNQIIEAYRLHTGATKRVARKRAVDLLGRVGIPQPEGRIDDYPHQFSGGMRQRVMIAMALACDPELLIADEPTTALDVTVQAQILNLIADLQEEFGTAVILITHDLGVVAGVADEALVMYAGRPVEHGTLRQVFYEPRHPYTWGLLSSVTRLDREPEHRLRPISGNPPSLIDVPSGCPFHPRCPYRMLPEPCSTEVPEYAPVNGGHLVACHLSEQERTETFARDILPRVQSSVRKGG